MCGGDVIIINGSTLGICEFCGSKQTIPTVSEEKYKQLFNRANDQRKQQDFDGAINTYNTLLGDFPKEAEVYWDLCLCKYGIEYVRDPSNDKSLPTCYRFRTMSILEDIDYLHALEFADPVARGHYTQEAQLIDQIQKNIFDVVSSEKPYDVFISYKERDESGRTEDSIIAQRIYQNLTMEGLRVFFAPVSLDGKQGEKYEPYIFAGLYSAKVLLLIGTKVEYLYSTWVKNEWARFLLMMQTDHSKTALLCFKKSGGELPSQFKPIQGFDIDGSRFYDSVEKKILNLCRQPQGGLSSHLSDDAELLIKRGLLALSDSEWPKAIDCFSKAIDINPHCAQAFLGLFLANNQAHSLQEIDGSQANFEDLNWKHVLEFGDDALKAEINSVKLKWADDWIALSEKIKKRKEKIAQAEKLLAANENGYIAAKTDGTVICVVKGYLDEGEGKQFHLNWSHIVAVYAGDNDSLGSIFCGIRDDGKVLMVSTDGHEILDIDDEGITKLQNVSSISIGKTAIVVIYNNKRSEVLTEYSEESLSCMHSHENVYKAIIGETYIAYLTTKHKLIIDGQIDNSKDLLSIQDIVSANALDNTLVVINSYGQLISNDHSFNRFASELRGVIEVKKASEYTLLGYYFQLWNGTLLSYDYDRSWQKESGIVAAFGSGYQFCITLKDSGYLSATKMTHTNQEVNEELNTIIDRNGTLAFKLFSNLDTIEEEQKKISNPDKLTSIWHSQYELNLKYRNLIALNDHAIAFVRSNGSVGYLATIDAYHADRATQKWNRIIAVTMNDNLVVGLTDKGKVLIADEAGNEHSREVENWPAIKQIAVTGNGVLGLDFNGKVHTTDRDTIYTELNKWKEIDRLFVDDGVVYGIAYDSTLFVLGSEEIPKELQQINNALDVFPSSFAHSAAVLCKDYSIKNFNNYQFDMSSVIQCFIENGDVYSLHSDGSLYKNKERLIYCFHDDILDRESKYDEFISFTCNIWGRCAAITKYGYIAVWNYNDEIAKHAQLSRVIRDYDLEKLEMEREELFALRSQTIELEQAIVSSSKLKTESLEKEIRESRSLLNHEAEQIEYWDNQRSKYASTIRFFLQQEKYKEAGKQQDEHRKKYKALQERLAKLESSWIGPYIVESKKLDPYVWCSLCHMKAEKYVCFLNDDRRKTYACIECVAKEFSFTGEDLIKNKRGNS